MENNKTFQSKEKTECEFYDECGGCSSLHVKFDEYKKTKLHNVESYLKRSELISDNVDQYHVIPKNSRRRVSFRALYKDGVLRIGFNRYKSNDLVDISKCILIDNSLNMALLGLRSIINKFNTILFSSPMYFNLTKISNGIILEVSTNHILAKKEYDLLKLLPEEIILITANNNIIRETTPPIVKFDGHDVPYVVGSFLQVSEYSQQIMIDFVKNSIITGDKILDLFCGLGPYSTALSNKKIVAIDNNPLYRVALSRYNNISFQVRDLIKSPVKKDYLDTFDAVIINPPARGALEQIIPIAKSNIKNVVMISCNLKSFTTDAIKLIKGGFLLKKIEILDQFLYTAHVEMMAYFTR